jgi:hypothetical protein
VTPNGRYTGTITPSAGSGGGTFTPAYLYWSESSASKMFVYTPDTEGAKSITLATSGSLLPPAIITYNASKRVTTSLTCTPDPCDYYPFNQPGCNTAVSYGGMPGPYPCSPAVPILKSNFTVPAANTSVVLKVSDTSMLYVGEGIKIGPGYFQIVDILSSDSIEAQHNGMNTTVGLSMVATHPSQGCSQYPITPAGVVSLQITPTVKGRAANGTVVNNSVTLTGSSNYLSYGFSGPRRLVMDISIEATIANSPYGLSISLPKTSKTSNPAIPAFSASFYDGTKWIVLATVLASSDLFLWKPDNTVITSASVILRVSGSYEASS